MKETELYMCKKCYCTDIYFDTCKQNIAYACGVGCNNWQCEQQIIIKTAFTKKAAERKARKAWNKLNAPL